MALGILGGMIAVVGVAAIVVATGGIAGAFLPVAAAGVVSSVTTSAAIGALVMGTMAVGSRAVADFRSGNVSDGSEYVKAGEHGAIVGAVTGAIGGGFEALSATWGLAATMTAMGVDGMVETWVQNTMDGVDTHWWDLVGAFGFSALSYGILDNLARSAKGPKPQNLDDLDDYAKRLEDINNRSYDDWLSDTVDKSSSKTGFKGGRDTVAYHSVGGDNSAKKIQSVLDGIDISYTSPEKRFGQGFYAVADGNTTVAELAYHGTDAKYSIRYDMNLEGQKVLDLTDPKIASEWGFLKGESSFLVCQNNAEIALDEGYNVIKVHSYRDAGINYVIYDNFDEILQPQMVTPIGD